MKATSTPKQAFAVFKEYQQNLHNASVVEMNEKPHDKKLRIQRLEKNFEQWAAYYFPKYYTSKPATFHTLASRRIIRHDEWFEVRSWSRDMAKSVRAMMEVLYLMLTKRKHNVLLVSNTLDHAVELLFPFRKELESNVRIINDYGQQRSITKWKEDKFKTLAGAQFRALGKGQNPRGTRNENYRPDVILIDDIDNDEEIRNPERVKAGVNWIEQSLIGTRSTSEKHPLLILVCGNIIGRYCSVSELAKRANKHDIVNIIDEKGQPAWAEKVSLSMIERIRASISENAFQQEYMNNPMPQGYVFKELHFNHCPKLKSCDSVIIYADPATSNREVTGGSHKAIGIIAKKKNQYFLYKVWLDNMSNSTFIDILFEAHGIVKDEGVDVTKVYIENNTLQNPFYEQVLLPLVRKKSQTVKTNLPITPDTRKKADKFIRIEATLEPLNRLGNLILNKKEERNNHMQRLVSQMHGVAPKAKIMDGPDMLEGGVWMLQKRNLNNTHYYFALPLKSRKY